MIFGKKEKRVRCRACGNKCNESFTFCPYCGSIVGDFEQEARDFGMLGKSDIIQPEVEENFAPQGSGITDRILDSLLSSMMRSIDKQMRSQIKNMDKNFENAEIKTMPNGIRIRIGPGMPQQTEMPRVQKRGLTEEQLKKMNSLPREKAKTNVKRIGDKIFYELVTPDISSPENVFVSKLESGYEIKAIGNKQVYVNNIPINLPIKKCSVSKDKLLLEFGSLD